MRLSFNQLK